MAEVEDPKPITVDDLAELYRELEDEPISEVLPKHGISAADLLAAEGSVLMALEAELRAGMSSPLASRLRREEGGVRREEGGVADKDVALPEPAIWEEPTSHDGAAPGSAPKPAIEPPPVPEKPSFMRFGPSALQTPAPLAPAVDATVPTVQTPTLLSPLPAAAPVVPSQSVTPSTTELATPQLKAKPATPFRPLPSEALGFNLERFAALEAALQKPGGARPAVLAQFLLDEAGYARVAAHWQHEIASHPPLSAELARLVAAARDEPDVPAPGGRGGTVAMETPADPSATIRAQGPGVPGLTVDQYAWVTATLRRAGVAGRAEALTRLRLTEASFQDLEAQWRAAFASQPELKHAFIASLTKHFG